VSENIAEKGSHLRIPQKNIITNRFDYKKVESTTYKRSSTKEKTKVLLLIYEKTGNS